MCERVPGFHFKAGLARMACLAFLAAACLAQAQQQPAAPPSTAEDSLKTFLQSHLRSGNPGFDKTTRYWAALVGLSGDEKREAIVRVAGRAWCGSGGCTTFVFARKGASYTRVGWIPATHAPIRVLKSTSHGWRNISAWVRGETVIVGRDVVTEPNYEAELRFDGTTYDWVPSEPHARPLVGKVPGEVVISGSEEGTLLFP